MCWNTTSGQLVYEILDSMTRSAYWNFPRISPPSLFCNFMHLCKTLFVVIDFKFPSPYIFNSRVWNFQEI